MSFFKRLRDGSFIPADKDEEPPVEFKPDEFKKSLTEDVNKALENTKTELTTQLKPLQEMATLIMNERTEREKKAREAKEREDKENEGNADEEFLLNPSAAIDKRFASRDAAILTIASQNAIRDTLSDKEYYHGKVKEQADKLIASLPLQHRSNPESLMNCYKLAVYDHQEAIQKGEIQKRNNAVVFEGGSTGAHSTEDPQKSDKLTSEEEAAAKALGISSKDWASSRRELTYV